jgi:hypothetical protein
MTSANDIYRVHPTQTEIDEVLDQRLIAALGTRNDDGSIHLTYLLFLYENGRFYLETASSTRKARNVASGGIGSILVQGTASGGRSLMVSAEGSARLIDLPEADAFNHRIRAKYMVDDAVDAVDRSWGRFDDVAIEITPTRWRSWTGTGLVAATEKDLGRPYGELWLPD